MEAKGCDSFIVTKTGAVSCITKPWWSVGFADSIAKIIADLFGTVVTNK